MTNLTSYAPPPTRTPPSLSDGSDGGAPTATDWLTSPRTTSLLAQFRAEDAQRAQLHDAHVSAWLDVDVCGYCGEFSPKLRKGMCPACKEAHDDAHRDEWEHEAREYRASGYRF